MLKLVLDTLDGVDGVDESLKSLYEEKEQICELVSHYLFLEVIHNRGLRTFSVCAVVNWFHIIYF